MRQDKPHNLADDVRVTLWLYRKVRTRIERRYLKTFKDHHLAIRGSAGAAYLYPVIPPHNSTKTILEILVRRGKDIPEAIQKDSKESFTHFLSETAEEMKTETFAEYRRQYGAIYTGRETILPMERIKKEWMVRRSTSRGRQMSTNELRS